MVLQKIIDIQNVGRIKKFFAPSAGTFAKCALIFGENGWGKSTIAEILRSLTADDPRVLNGRRSLPLEGQQKVILLIDGRQSVFDDGLWAGQKPRAHVFDACFINDNVFSGDTVSYGHLQRQYGLAIGEAGVRLIGEMVELDRRNDEVNALLRTNTAKLQEVIRSLGFVGLTIEQFVELPSDEEIDQKIEEKTTELGKAQRSAEIKRTTTPTPFQSLIDEGPFKAALGKTLSDVSEEAISKVRAHVAAHVMHSSDEEVVFSHEQWLERGIHFAIDRDCPFCGQELRNRTLVDAYQAYFGESFRNLAFEIRNLRNSLEPYLSGAYRAATIDKNQKHAAQVQLWHALAGIAPVDLELKISTIERLEGAAKKIDAALVRKQENMLDSVKSAELDEALEEWKIARRQINRVNEAILAYAATVQAVKAAVGELNINALNTELRWLRAIKRRHEPDVVEIVAERNLLIDEKDEISRKKETTRLQLYEHSQRVIAQLGRQIDDFLRRLNAGFRLRYLAPEFLGGREPSAPYQIVIGETPIPVRGQEDPVAEPSFRNTLSSSDKTVLALAFFLAQISATPDLSSAIVVLDDPISSFDEFRRSFTANEIRKLVGMAAQVIVLSHDKNFLRLLWDKIDRANISTFALGTGAQGVVTLSKMDIERATQPRVTLERLAITEFLNGEEGHSPPYVRTLLRPLLETFYRQADSTLFAPDETLEAIIRKVEHAGAQYAYYGALETLRAANEYTRNYHHGAVPGRDDNTNVEELRGYCREVIELTYGA